MAQPHAKRAVEIDGPSHFITKVESSGRGRPLRRLGWDVVHVPFFDWDNLKGTAEKDAYLRTALLRLREQLDPARTQRDERAVSKLGSTLGARQATRAEAKRARRPLVRS